MIALILDEPPYLLDPAASPFVVLGITLAIFMATTHAPRADDRSRHLQRGRTRLPGAHVTCVRQLR
jgi:hypothetical protein